MKIDFAAIRAGVDLVALVESHGVELRRTGFQLVGLCPFHGPEKTASFFVHAERGCFFCHGCGARGDAVDFVRLIEHVSMEEAVARLTGEGARPMPMRRAATQARDARLPERDAALLWSRLAEHDDEAETYLAARGLFHRDPDVLRFNIGGTNDDWLDAKVGYRVAFAVRDPLGNVQTISLRHVGPGAPPYEKKALVVPGLSTKGAAIVSPAIAQLALADSEFESDRILVCEGGTSWLGASALFSQATEDFDAPSTWPVGVIGVRQAAGVVTAFAAVVRWRGILVGLDADASGRAAVPEVEAAARLVGAREVLAVEIPLNKKDWAEVAQVEYAGG